MIQAAFMVTAGMLSAILLGLGGRWTARSFVREDIAPFVGFSVAIGSFVSGGLRGIDVDTDLESKTLKLGMALGLAVLWYVFFRRHPVKD